MPPIRDPLDSLTTDQLGELERYSAGWLDFSHAPCDRPAVSQALSSLYHAIGFQPPSLIWCQSLWQLAVMPAIAQLVLHDDDGKLQAELRDRLSDPLWLQMWQNLSGQLEAARKSSVSPNENDQSKRLRPGPSPLMAAHEFLGDNIRLSLLASLDRVLCLAQKAISQKLSHRLKNSLRETLFLRDSVFPGMRGRLPASLMQTQFSAELNAIARRRPEIQFLSQLGESGRTLVDHLLENAEQPALNNSSEVQEISTLSTLLLDTRSAILWPTLLEWLPLYGFIRDCLPVGVDDEFASSQIDAWLICKKYCLALACFGGFAFACEMPRMLCFDQRGVLHRENGPAFEFADGYRGYYWHGVSVPEGVIEHPQSITPMDIDGERNVEVRRIMIERYGVARYVKDSGAWKIHEDECGLLYMKEFKDDEPIVMVRVQNASYEPDGSIKEYFLRVPPHIDTARAAVAWTFGLRADEYNPSQES